MYARLVQFTFGPNAHEKAEQLAGDLGPAIGALKGCKGVTFFGDEADGEYGLFVLWESQEDAEATAQVIRPRLEKGLSGNIQGPPRIRLFKVIEH